jgi:hypothetical protein
MASLAQQKTQASIWGQNQQQQQQQSSSFSAPSSGGMQDSLI